MVADHRVELGKVHPLFKGQWVEIKPFLSYAERAYLDQAGLESMTVPRDGKGDASLKIDARAGSAAWFETCITGALLLPWDHEAQSFTGDPLPLGRLAIYHPSAHPDLIERTVIAVREYYEEQSLDFPEEDES